MAKGKTNQPLRFWVASTWRQHPAILALEAQGHIVHEVAGLIAADGSVHEPDLILHPAAHGWSEPMFQTEKKKDGTEYAPYLEVALSAARKRKKEGAK
jgi:hypothetical protein